MQRGITWSCPRTSQCKWDHIFSMECGKLWITPLSACSIYFTRERSSRGDSNGLISSNIMERVYIRWNCRAQRASHSLQIIHYRWTYCLFFSYRNILSPLQFSISNRIWVFEPTLLLVLFSVILYRLLDENTRRAWVWLEQKKAHTSVVVVHLRVSKLSGSM